MNLRAAVAEYIAAKCTPRVRIPANGICPVSRFRYFECHCDNHRCGLCGRRWSQRSEHSTTPNPTLGCQCERNRRRNEFPPHWRQSPLKASSVCVLDGTGGTP